MARVGITGHMNVRPEATELVYQAIVRELDGHPTGELTGVSCMAAGSDSIFAQAVLDLGGRLEVILPAADYRDRKVSPDHAPQFDRLLARASSVRTMPYARASRAAYEAANEALVGTCDQLFAVWDGQPSGGRGGTGDVVRYAQERGTPVVVIWPDGARRA